MSVRIVKKIIVYVMLYVIPQQIEDGTVFHSYKLYISNHKIPEFMEINENVPKVELGTARNFNSVWTFQFFFKAKRF